MKPRLASVVLLSAALVTGCSGHPPANQPKSSDRYVITREQMDERNFHTAYEAVEALHSNWLSPRGTDSFTNPSEVQVIYDNAHMGGVQALRNISTMSISFIRWYDGLEATQRWGVGHNSGVIFVSTSGQ